MPGRTYVGNVYRYGMNGQEKDDEIAGAGNAMSAEYWEYDSRLGRRWNIDPLTKPNQSPYVTFDNNPIRFNDPQGLAADDKSKDESLPTAPTKGGQEITTTESKYTAKDPSTGFQISSPQPISELNLSDAGFDFIKRHEGYVGYVYNDLKTGKDGQRTHWYEEKDHNLYDKDGKVIGTGTPTIGYGYVLSAEELTQEKWKDKPLTKVEADEQLKAKVVPYVQAVKNLMTGKMLQGQFDAAVSFTYNVGYSHKKGNTGGLPDSKFLAEWNKVGGYNYSNGAWTGDLMLRYSSPAIILGRRQAEVKLFENSTYKNKYE